MVKIVWSDYIQYRATLRGFDLEQIEEILRFSASFKNWEICNL
ncbi:hypothetical protein NO2A_03738 [Planktothrix agardhii]|nr:hypothetical protein NO2A_03738 [Planktothrix agardhii]